MRPKRNLMIVTIFIIGRVLFAGCTPSAAVPDAPPSPTSVAMLKGPGVVWHLVVISESSGWGLGEALAKQIEKDVGGEGYTR